MNTLAGAILLIIGFGSLALGGQWFFNRFFKQEILEHHHSAGEAMMGVVGTLFSVLLGFMIAFAMERYDNAQMHGEQEANDVASIYWVSQGFSEIDRQRLRDLCRLYVTDVVINEWPKMERGEKIDHGSSAYQELWRAIVMVVAEDSRQGNLQAGLIASMQSLGENRRARILLAQKGLPTVLWGVVILGALITLALSFVFASKYPKVQSFMTVLVATALALNIWLLAAYSSPFSGELKLLPTMFELLQESVFSVSSNASLLYHARFFLEHSIVIA